MKSRSLLVLIFLVLTLGLFIGVWERHQPTTGEAAKAAEKLLPSMEEQDVRSLELSGPKGQFAFMRTGEKWRLDSPIDAEADQSAVKSLVGSVLRLKITRRLEEEKADLEKYGLKEPAYRILLKGENSEEHRLEIGMKMPLGSERAMRLDGGPILLADSFFTSDLEKDLNAWRSHELISLSLYDLAAIEIREADASIEALKLGKKWHLKSPVDDFADEEHLGRLISGLNRIKILDFVDENPDLQAMGLDHPRYRLSLTPSDGKPAVHLDFGVKREVKGKTEIACRRGGKEYFLVDDSAENALGKAPVLWREPRIAPFQSWDAQLLEISSGKKKFSAHKKEGVWKLESGADADASKIESRLSTIAKTRAKNFDLITTGQPKLGEIHISLKAPGAEKAEDLRIILYQAMEDGGDVALTVTGREKLMGIAAEDAEKILGDLEELEKPEPTPGPQEGD